jgi:hypothetical protein
VQIAKNNGYNESVVVALNPQMTNPEIITEGSTLRLPCQAKCPALPSPPRIAAHHLLAA